MLLSYGMNKLNLFAIIYYYFLSSSKCSDLYSDEVIKYDSESFKANVGESVPHFINFFAPWCGYCKRLKPVWDELAEKYNVESCQKVVIAKVDCTSETPLCAEENISGYPSLIYYDAGERKGVKYQGRRDLTGLEEFLNENFEGALKKKTIPPVVSVPETTSRELTDENFLSTISYGLHFIKFHAPWCGHCQKMAASWEELAENLEHDKSVTISSVDCSKQKKACQEFDIKGYPTMLWIVDGKKVEQYQGARNLDGYKKFLSEMKEAIKDRFDTDEGKIPDEIGNTKDLVVELTEDNFENAIAKGYTFVKFFVPWCGHSKKLTPIWNELAVKFASESDVTIAKVNCFKYEKLCEQYKVVGYPTLLLFNNGKHITEYSGSRKLELLHIFLLNYLHHTEL